MTRFIVVPQWQGSPSTRAMQLIDGAQAISGDLPRAATTVLDVPMEAGESLESGVHRLSALLRVRGMLDEALAGHREPVLVVGGDCGIAAAPVAHAAARHPGLAVVWIDAHPDLNTPESSPSGAFSGMVVRSLLGEGPAGLALEPGVVEPARLVLAATRAFDPAEEEFVDASGVTLVSVAELADPESLARAVRGTDADAVYVHVDVDALDPAVIAGNAHPEPFGVSIAVLTAALARLRAEFPLVGASLTGYAPASLAVADDDLGAILRIVGALA